MHPPMNAAHLRDTRKSAALLLALRLFLIPFLVGGIASAYWTSNHAFGLAQDDLGGHVTLPWMASFLALMPIGAYLGALLGYSMLLAVFALFLSTARFEAMAAALPPENPVTPTWLLAPFAAVRRAILG
jgi:hypothetical protein